jgi:hypothetical protein
VLRTAIVACCFVLGCKSDPNAPPCEVAGAKFMMIARGELAKLTGHSDTVDATRRAVHDQLPAMRDSLVNACKESNWAAPVRKCLSDAPSHVVFEGCLRDLSPEQRAALDKSW